MSAMDDPDYADDKIEELTGEILVLRARLEVAERLAEQLRFVADEEECGIGLIIDESNDQHNKHCLTCQRVLAARAVLSEWKAEK